MMDGYSVTEAASVLGVPTERVWELLARGVLSGRPEGDTGMRVFLQPRPQPAAPAPAADESGQRGNGSDRAELSPFRELLTEFRNLTERYGQALLALGEARGEVASLRSRVDLLEARMELRLPFGSQAPPTAWPLPAAPPETAAPPRPETGSEDEELEGHRARRRGARRATESFAEALARAEDPSVADLPPATAVHPGVEEPAVEPRAVEPSLPREVAPAEPMPELDEPEATAEPPAAESEAVAPDAPTEPDASGEPEAADGADEIDVLPAPVAIEEPEPDADDSADVLAAAAPEPTTSDELAADLDEGSVAAEAPERAEVAPIEPQEAPSVEPAQTVEDEAAPEPAAPIDFDEDRYTTVIEPPDWFEAEVEPVDAPPAEPDAATGADQPGPAQDEPAPPEVAPPASVSDDQPDEEPVAVAGEEPDPAESTPEPEADGADEMEVAGGGLSPGHSVEPPPEPAPASQPADDELPGSSELDEALAALEELRRRTQTTPAAGEWPPAPPGTAATSSPGAARPRPMMTAGPATRAYRRLRRIFPE